MHRVALCASLDQIVLEAAPVLAALDSRRHVRMLVEIEEFVEADGDHEDCHADCHAQGVEPGSAQDTLAQLYRPFNRTARLHSRPLNAALSVSRFSERLRIELQELDMGGTTARQWLTRSLVTVGAMFLATSAWAQASDITTVRMPVWDASGSVALFNVRTSEASGPDDSDYWETKAELRGQVGRYLTPHFKVEFAILAPMSYDFYEDVSVPVPAVPGAVGFTWVDRDVTVLSMQPAVTWQFFENTFVHPYVTAGISIDVANVHRFRDAGAGAIYLSGSRSIRFDVSPVDTRETVTEARPFVAFGTKSYFNERWFARPEVQLGLAGARLSQVS